MYLLEFLAIGAAAGWMAGRVTRGRRFGLLGNVIIGTIGSLVGGFVFSLLEISAYGTVGSFVMALVGAVVLLYLLGVLKARRI